MWADLREKYWPIIISTSRGMGKTFFLKKFGMQKIKDDLKTSIIENGLSSGRILSFDFSKSANIFQNEQDIFCFFPRLMVFFLCRLFKGTQVDGINFEEIKSLDGVATASGRQKKFREWLKHWQKNSGTERMMEEYIRLTNIAFNTTHDSPPVFLLDEIQSLCTPMDVKSTFAIKGTVQIHSHLSLLLTQLAGQLKPVCICTGTNNGKITSIAVDTTSKRISRTLEAAHYLFK